MIFSLSKQAFLQGAGMSARLQETRAGLAAANSKVLRVVRVAPKLMQKSMNGQRRRKDEAGAGGGLRSGVFGPAWLT